MFQGDFSAPSRAIDYRWLLPRLMGDFESRGGRVEIRTVAPGELNSYRAA